MTEDLTSKLKAELGHTVQPTMNQKNDASFLPMVTPFSSDKRCVSEVQNLSNDKQDTTAVDQVYDIQVAQDQSQIQNVKLSRQRNNGSELLMSSALNSSKNLKNVTAPSISHGELVNGSQQMRAGTDPATQKGAQKLGDKDSQQQQQVQNVFQFNLRVNNNNMNEQAWVNAGGVVVESQAGEDAMAGPNKISCTPTALVTSPKVQRRHSKPRPMSSKHRDTQRVFASQNSAAMPFNPYFIQSRRVAKKRPQSATRKTMLLGNTSLKTAPKAAADSFKSTALSMSYKNRPFIPSNNLIGSAPSQKQRRQQYTQLQPLQMDSHAVVTAADLLSEQSSAVGGPYNRSMKMPSHFGGAIPMATKQHSPSKIVPSGSSPQIRIKNKIPQMTLQSREDLYEQNMHTKIQINSLRNENRKINTKLQVLENQLVQKDKLFEDMYRAAFSQGKAIQYAANNTQVFHPTQIQNSLTPSQQAYGLASHRRHPSSGGKSQANNQQQQQAHQLINSYKRTIREQSRELDKKDMQVETIKRSVKMTQINQVLVENEAYRSECIRLRENLEQAMSQIKDNRHDHLTNHQTHQLDPRILESAASEMFKRDTQQDNALLSVLSDEKEQYQRQCEKLRNDNQTLLERLSEQQQAHITQNAKFQDIQNQLQAELQHAQSTALDQVSAQNAAELEQLKQQLLEVQRSATVTQVESNEANQQNAKIEQLQNELASAKDEVEQVRDIVQEKTLLTDKIKNQLRDSQAKIKKLQAASKKSDDAHQQELEQLRQELLDAKNEIDEKNQKLQEVQMVQETAAAAKVEESQPDYEKLIKELNERHQAEIAQLKSEHQKELQQSVEQVQAASQAEAQKKIQQLETQCENIQQQKSELEQKLEQTMAQLKSAEESQKEMKKTMEKKEDYFGLDEAIEQRLEDQKKKYIQLESFKDEIIKEKAVKEETIVKLRDDNGKLHKNVRSALERANSYQKTVNSLETDIEQLKKEIDDKKQELEFSENKLAAEKFEKQKQLDEKEEQIEMLKLRITQHERQKSVQSPPLPNNEQRRRSSKQTVRQSLPESAYGGDSEFDRATISEHVPKEAQKQEDNYSEDRSDLGFTSNEGDEDLANEILGKQNSDDKPHGPQKITVNDKTIYTPADGFRSPKLITADSPHVKEGFLRLRHACQVKFIRHDMIENFLFGADYKPEIKLSIRRIKEATMASLKMENVAALDFARFVVESVGSSIQVEDGSVDEEGFIRVDEDRTAQAFRIMMYILGRIQSELIYFRADKEEKMQIIIGQSLQNRKTKTRLLGEIQALKMDELTFDQFLAVFEKSGLAFSTKETFQCCFIFLLKKTQGYMSVRKKDLVDFVHSSGAKAHDFTMTGANIPVETELAYSSDSEGAHEIQDEIVISNEAEPPTPEYQAVTQPQKVAKVVAPTAAPSMPPPAVAEGINSEGESSDDFGANDSRSEYSAKHKSDEDDIKSEIEAQEEKEHVEVQLIAIEQKPVVPIEDSLNDRDLEVSMANKAAVVGQPAPPLPLVIEAQEHQEIASIEMEESKKVKILQERNQQIQHKRYATQPNPPRPPTVEAEHEDTQSSDLGCIRVGKGKKRPKPKINIIVDKPIKSKTLSYATGSTERDAAPTSIHYQAAQVTSNNTDQENQSNQEAISLQPLKKEAPIPFGITVTRQQSSAMKHESSIETASQREKNLAKDSILGAYTPAATPDKEMNINTDRIFEKGEGIKYDSLMNGGLDSQYQTVQAQIKGGQDNFTEESKTGNVVTNKTQTSQDPLIVQEDLDFEVDVQELRNDVQGYGRPHGVNTGDNSLISPIQRFASYNNANLSMPDASKIVDDSFGQGSYQCSAEKPMQQHLPPIELNPLRLEKPNPDGIKVAELLTDQSSRLRSYDLTPSMTKAEIQQQKKPLVRDFMVASEKTSEARYSDVINTEEEERYHQKQAPLLITDKKSLSEDDYEDDDYEF